MLANTEPPKLHGAMSSLFTSPALWPTTVPGSSQHLVNTEGPQTLLQGLS